MTQKTRANLSTYNAMHSVEIHGQEYRVEFLNGPETRVLGNGKKYQGASGLVFEVDDEGTGHAIGRIFVPATDAGNARPHEIEAAVRAL